jgi:hypothetical protein
LLGFRIADDRQPLLGLRRKAGTDERAGGRKSDDAPLASSGAS